jgi:hypothetical protein
MDAAAFFVEFFEQSDSMATLGYCREVVVGVVLFVFTFICIRGTFRLFLRLCIGVVTIYNCQCSARVGRVELTINRSPQICAVCRQGADKLIMKAGVFLLQPGGEAHVALWLPVDAIDKRKSQSK